MKVKLSIIVCLLITAATLVSAQTTGFTYQGSLKDGINPASGNYDFEFRLFDALAAGGQVGPVISQNAVAVAGGIFSIRLDFGNQFPGANRFLEIRVQPASGGGFTTLAPRQPVDSSPHSIKSINTETAASATNSVQLGGASPQISM